MHNQEGSQMGYDSGDEVCRDLQDDKKHWEKHEWLVFCHFTKSPASWHDWSQTSRALLLNNINVCNWIKACSKKTLLECLKSWNQQNNLIINSCSSVVCNTATYAYPCSESIGQWNKSLLSRKGITSMPICPRNNLICCSSTFTGIITKVLQRVDHNSKMPIVLYGIKNTIHGVKGAVK